MREPRLVQDYLRDILDAGKDRVLVRYSGTQPQCRVMVESTEIVDARQACNLIADKVKKSIGM